MNLLTFPQTVATTAVWREDDRPILGFFMTLGQIAIGRVRIASTESDRFVLQFLNVIKRVSWSDEQPIETVAISENDLLACWHLTTFDQPKGGALVADNFDEQLQLSLRGSTVALYRASVFKVPHGADHAG
jgi:hypothetical protein